MKKLARASLLIFLISFPTLTFSNELPDNVVQSEETITESTITETSQSQETSSSSTTSKDLSAETQDVINQINDSNDILEHALTGMTKDMSQADDGRISASTSAFLGKIYGIVAQFMRGVIILGLLILSGPDLLCLAFPGLEFLFTSKNNRNSSSSLDGGSSGSRGGSSWLLSRDYYAAKDGGSSRGSGSSLEGGGSSSSNGDNPFKIYIGLHLKTLVWSGICIVIFMTPLGLVITSKIISFILWCITKIVEALGGVV